MNTIPVLTSFLGWCLVLNIGLLMFSTIMIMLCKTWITKLHAKLLNMNEDALSIEYFRYLANYKVLVIVFNLAPWVALKLMSAE
ncbi:hypothetical protein VSU19_02870 [Verrucomicrobiales bacterium BCK34]|nr:hypothetical protein [Verrucomicrobiales bacterium BCK34]